MLHLLRRKAVALVSTVTVLVGGAVLSAPPAAAYAPYGCSYDLAYHWYKAAGLEFKMQSYSQYVLDARVSWANLDSAITALRTTDGRTLRNHTLVFYYQIGTASSPWKLAHRAPFSATPSFSSYRYNGTLHNPHDSTNTDYWYGKNVRIIVNAQSHNFVSPWFTVGKPLHTCP